MFAKMRGMNGRHRGSRNGAMYMRVRNGGEGETKSDDETDSRLDNSLVISIDSDTIGDSSGDNIKSNANCDSEIQLSDRMLGNDDTPSKPMIDGEPNAFSVRLLEVGKKERNVVIERQWTIGQIKEKYFEKEIKEGLNVRFILSGQILKDDSLVSGLPRLQDGSSIHVAMSKYRGLQSLPNTIGLTETSNEGCGPDGFVSDEQLARMLADEERRNAGLSPIFADAASNGDRRALIGALALFDEQSSQIGANGMNERRRAELARFQDNCDFFCGLLMGGMLGIWVFLLLAFNRRYVRSRRFRVGILIGVMGNIFINGVTDHSGHHTGEGDTNSDGSDASSGADPNNPPQGATTSETS